MKCKRCQRTMERVKIAPNSYVFRCPNCGLEIGKRREETIRQEAQGKG